MWADRKAWTTGSPVFSGLLFEGCLQSSLSKGHLMFISLLSSSQDGEARVLSGAGVLVRQTQQAGDITAGHAQSPHGPAR